MSEFEAIKFEAADGIAKITLNRPEAINVINATLVKELARGARGTPGADQQRSSCAAATIRPLSISAAALSW